MPPRRAAGWSAPEDHGGDDGELDGRDLICDCLVDEAGWPRRCAGWLTRLHTSEYPRRSTCVPEAITLAGCWRWPASPGRPRSCRGSPPMPVNWPAPAAWPAWGRAAALPGRQAGRRRRVAELDLDFREFCRRSKLPRSERCSDPFAAERYRRHETGIPSYEAYDPFRHRQRGRYA
jgi:hypothetical protein